MDDEDLDLRNYDYYEAVTDDIVDYVRDNYEGCQRPSEECLHDALWVADSVTGNGSGSYFCNSYKSMLTVTGNMSLLKEACSEFACMEELGNKLVDEEWEWADVAIRCYVLDRCISDALGRLDDEGFFDGEDDDDDEEEEE